MSTKITFAILCAACTSRNETPGETTRAEPDADADTDADTDTDTGGDTGGDTGDPVLPDSCTWPSASIVPTETIEPDPEAPAPEGMTIAFLLSGEENGRFHDFRVSSVGGKAPEPGVVLFALYARPDGSWTDICTATFDLQAQEIDLAEIERSEGGFDEIEFGEIERAFTIGLDRAETSCDSARVAAILDHDWGIAFGPLSPGHSDLLASLYGADDWAQVEPRAFAFWVTIGGVAWPLGWAASMPVSTEEATCGDVGTLYTEWLDLPADLDRPQVVMAKAPYFIVTGG